MMFIHIFLNIACSFERTTIYCDSMETLAYVKDPPLPPSIIVEPNTSILNISLYETWLHRNIFLLDAWLKIPPSPPPPC